MKAEVAIATEMNTPLFPSRIIANMSHALPKNSNASFVVIRDVSKLFSSNPAGAIGEHDVRTSFTLIKFPANGLRAV